MPERKLIWVTIPKGTRPAQCRGSSCQAVIYFAPSPKSGKNIPIDPDVDGGHAPTEEEEGLGVMHHQTCVDVEQFRRAKR